MRSQVLAAISGAIQAYLVDEEAYLVSASLAAAPATAPPPHNLWALAGRQGAMQLRLLLQRRNLR